MIVHEIDLNSGKEGQGGRCFIHRGFFLMMDG